MPYLDDGREERLSVHREGTHVSRADHRAHADHAEPQSRSRDPLGAHSGRRKGNLSAYRDSRRRRDAESGAAVSAVPSGIGEAARQSRQHAASARSDQPELQARLRLVRRAERSERDERGPQHAAAHRRGVAELRYRLFGPALSFAR